MLDFNSDWGSRNSQMRTNGHGSNQMAMSALVPKSEEWFDLELMMHHTDFPRDCTPIQESRDTFSGHAYDPNQRLIRTKSVEKQLLAGFLCVQYRSEVHPILDTIEHRFLMQVHCALSCQDNQ